MHNGDKKNSATDQGDISCLDVYNHKYDQQKESSEFDPYKLSPAKTVYQEHLQ